ncbi:MAG TPA: tRNA (N(6)-L-threonylcarbamoyladenosine(37)-C(2))-methylthiotransferase MtaB, partial [Gammaproteobacteria bacterium]|nr:tRNA (N(6)-L-threonylcarbamoyladenosine(37)-C(2))-methylthiotransferase MtaB [Gammaproteobacteria bacterium]
GSDLGANLYQLVQHILEETDLPRLRFASVEPWDLPLNFFELFSNPRLMPHMHLPLQSGSDRILRQMARRCLTQDFAELVRQARLVVPDFNVTTDIIAGFPGETAF